MFCVLVVRSELQKALDSYQEDDLNRLRQRWSDALAKRKEVCFTKLSTFFTGLSEHLAFSFSLDYF